MAGRKIFFNGTEIDLNVTLDIRAGDHPDDSAGTKSFKLEAGEILPVEYGDETNIYLNGILITYQREGGGNLDDRIVVERGSKLDNQLNTNNAIEFLFDKNIQNLQIEAKNIYECPDCSGDASDED